jgi:lipopolysaccharide transport system ATP-binding protein
MSSEIVLLAEGLGKRYEIYGHPRDRLLQMLWGQRRRLFREHWALRGVSFEVRRGQMVGVIGRNGSGKSTLLQLVAGVLTPTEGRVRAMGRVAALLELGAGFHPDFSGRENVFLNGQILGMTQDQLAERYAAIVDFADIGDAIEQPVKTYSSGMVVRLAFAVAAHVEPDILIVDEALAVGDLSFQARCLDRIRQLRESGVSTLFVTHDLGTFQALCDYGYLLDEGTLLSEGAPDHLAAQYYNLSQEHEMRRQRRASAPAARASAPAVPDPAVVPGAGEAPGPGADAARDGPVVSIDDARRAIAAKDASTEYRFGSHDAVIEDFRLLDAQGHPCQALRVGERFTVELDVAVLAPLSDLAAAIMFRNAQGQNLFGANTRYDGPVPIGPLVAGARFRISIGMEMLLNPGEYLLHLGLAECRSDHVYVSLDNRDKVGVVTVHGKPVSYGLVHHCPDFSVAPLGTSGTGRSLAGMRS